MKHFFATLALYFASAFGVADACSLVIEPVSRTYRESSAAVLALPLSISYSPKAASSADYEGDVTETIRWRSLVSWKGKYRAGSEFSTVMSFPVSKDDSCGPWQPGKRGSETVILFLHGKEPFDYFVTLPLTDSDAFEFLESRR